jgi:DNA integrity scanning protein DisA with diadenylate cyclase activity
MHDVSRALIQHAQDLAEEVRAEAIVICADVLAESQELPQFVESCAFKVILVTRVASDRHPGGPADCTWVSVPDVHLTRTGQVKVAMLVALAQGTLHSGDRVVCLTGVHCSDILDTIVVLNLGTEPELFRPLDASMFNGHLRAEIFARVLALAAQLAAEGREGRPVGAIFVVGDAQHVLEQSRSLVLNPFHGYAEAQRNIMDPAVEETLKEFSAIDGAFVISGDGVVLAAGVHLVPVNTVASLTKGLGTRHAAAASMTASTSALAVVVSQSTGTVSVFRAGELIADIQRGDESRLALSAL